MTIIIRITILFLLINAYPFTGSGQANQTVQWRITVDTVHHTETVLRITADIAPGWHLYSQFLEEGGPVPTRFTFEHTTGLMLLGTPEEKGKAFRFHDDVYDMEITWYSDTVDFLQKLRVTEATGSMQCTVEYMTCNAHICVPDSREFIIEIPKRTR